MMISLSLCIADIMVINICCSKISNVNVIVISAALAIVMVVMVAAAEVVVVVAVVVQCRHFTPALNAWAARI